MAASSRRKGVRGEREFADLWRAAGWTVRGLEAGGDLWLERGGVTLHAETKRQERAKVPEWIRQVERDVPAGVPWVLGFRATRQPWQAIVPWSYHGMVAVAASDDARVFPARRDAFASVQAFIEDACGRAAVERKDCLRLTLLVEELFTNTVLHGHGGDTDEPVRLILDVDDAAIGVQYEDSAPPYDPFANRPEPNESPDVDDRAIGGLGITLITTMAQDVQYAERPGGNRITFRLRRSR